MKAFGLGLAVVTFLTGLVNAFGVFEEADPWGGINMVLMSAGLVWMARKLT